MNGPLTRHWRWYAGATLAGLTLGTICSTTVWGWIDAWRRPPPEPIVVRELCGSHVIDAANADDRATMLAALGKAVACIEVHRDTCADSTQADFDSKLERLRDTRDELRLRPEGLQPEETSALLGRIRHDLLTDEMPVICGTVLWENRFWTVR
jgi:hypothetical protein